MTTFGENDITRLASFPEQNPNPVIEISIEGKIIYLNPVARNHFPDLIEKQISHDLFSELRHQLSIHHAKELNDFKCELNIGGTTFEQKFFYLEGNNAIRIYSHDISERKQTERNLARLASFPEQNPSPIIEINLDKNITYINKACSDNFPDLTALTFEHELLTPFSLRFEELRSGEIENYSKEIYINETYYMQRASLLKEYGVIRIFNLDITQQKRTEEIIREKNKDITDSINYAKRIQAAILPSNEFVKQRLPDSFILYKPKDIVAGDFYWMEYTDDITFIAAADCTGHGVPGAMVSVVCSNALNRAVKEFGLRETGKILDKVTDLVIETFERSDTELKDGMDISLLAINTTEKEIEWSGANNPLWYFENGEFKEIKADKQPIGNFFSRREFTSHKINYVKGNMFYLLTDGFADQFGGADGKKFTYKRLREGINSIYKLNVSEQAEKLERIFDEWKGDLTQLDDVTIVGIRIK